MVNADAGIRILLILAASPVVILCLHVAAARMSKNPSRQTVAFKSAVWGYLPVALCLWIFVFSKFAGVRGAAAIAYCLLVYSSIAYTYFHFFNMSETARRIRILYEIYEAGSISSERMTALYKTTDVISIRLERLVAMRQLTYDGGYYAISGRTLLWAGHLIFFWRRLLGLDSEDDEGYGDADRSCRNPEDPRT